MKPTLKRYYKNPKKGTYAHLSGSPIAIKACEKNWRSAKMVVVRVSKREYEINVPRFGEIVKAIGLGSSFCSRDFKKNQRLGTVKFHHPVALFSNE